MMMASQGQVKVKLSRCTLLVLGETLEVKHPHVPGVRYDGTTMALQAL